MWRLCNLDGLPRLSFLASYSTEPVSVRLPYSMPQYATLSQSIAT